MPLQIFQEFQDSSKCPGKNGGKTGSLPLFRFLFTGEDFVRTKDDEDMVNIPNLDSSTKREVKALGRDFKFLEKVKEKVE